MSTIDLTVTLEDSRELTHYEKHRFVQMVAEQLFKCRLLQSGDVIETDCGFGIEGGEQKFLPTSIEVQSSIWGGPN